MIQGGRTGLCAGWREEGRGEEGGKIFWLFAVDVAVILVRERDGRLT